MKGTLTTIQPSGAMHAKVIGVDHYQALRVAVGGNIELVSGFSSLEGQRCDAYVNGDGISKGLAPNPTASELWWKNLDSDPRYGNALHVLYGPVAIVTGDDEFIQASLG